MAERENIAWIFSKDKKTCMGFCLTTLDHEDQQKTLDLLDRQPDKMLKIQTLGKILPQLFVKPVDWLDQDEQKFVKASILKDLGPIKEDQLLVFFKIYDLVGKDWFPRMNNLTIREYPDAPIFGIKDLWNHTDPKSKK